GGSGSIGEVVAVGVGVAMGVGVGVAMGVGVGDGVGVGVGDGVGVGVGDGVGVGVGDSVGVGVCVAKPTSTVQVESVQPLSHAGVAGGDVSVVVPTDDENPVPVAVEFVIVP